MPDSQIPGMIPLFASLRVLVRGRDGIVGIRDALRTVFSEPSILVLNSF
jgi:hypothetical protein